MVIPPDSRLPVLRKQAPERDRGLRPSALECPLAHQGPPGAKTWRMKKQRTFVLPGTLESLPTPLLQPYALRWRSFCFELLPPRPFSRLGTRGSRGVRPRQPSVPAAHRPPYALPSRRLMVGGCRLAGGVAHLRRSTAPEKDALTVTSKHPDFKTVNQTVTPEGP